MDIIGLKLHQKIAEVVLQNSNVLNKMVKELLVKEHKMRLAAAARPCY